MSYGFLFFNRKLIFAKTFFVYPLELAGYKKRTSLRGKGQAQKGVGSLEKDMIFHVNYSDYLINISNLYNNSFVKIFKISRELF